jgi:hypothetical protein
LSRALPLWRTDFPGDRTGRQCHTFGLLHWAPLNATLATPAGEQADYDLRSGMSAGVNLALFTGGDTRQPKTDYARYPFDEVRKRIAQYREIQKYFYGDYYPLTEYTQANDAWMAYQLDLPESGEGLVVVLKRPLSRFTEAAFPLRALDPRASYEVTNLDGGARSVSGGAELGAGGLVVRLAAQPASALIRYRRVR